MMGNEEREGGKGRIRIYERILGCAGGVDGLSVVGTPPF